jgi:hypothetical protein
MLEDVELVSPDKMIVVEGARDGGASEGDSVLVEHSVSVPVDEGVARPVGTNVTVTWPSLLGACLGTLAARAMCRGRLFSGPASTAAASDKAWNNSVEVRISASESERPVMRYVEVVLFLCGVETKRGRCSR